MQRHVLAGLLLAPAVGLGIGVWAEFAGLGPPLLLAVAVPAIAVATISAASVARARPLTTVLIGATLGLLTFALAEGTYLALHYARGGTLNPECCSTQPAMAATLFGIHVAVGAVVGLGVGAGVALAMATMAARRTARMRHDDRSGAVIQ